MSDKLLGAIKRVQSNIANDPFAFKTEPPTKQSLILPVLDALGWDVFDHARVQTEYETESGKADWALKVKDQETPVILVEAKSLSTNIDEKERRQLSRYCFDEGVPTALITNGNEWFAYRPLLTKLDFRHRLLFQLRLDKDDAAASAKKLNLLRYEDISKLDNEDTNIWLNAYWDKQARDELLNAFSGVLRDSIVDWSGRGSGEFPAGKVKAWLRKKMFSSRAPTRRLTDQRERNLSVSMDGNAVIIDGERMAVGKMTEAMQCVANWLIQRGHIEPHECPIPITNSTDRCFIHTEPVHPNGDSFRGEKRLANGLYLETHAGNPQNVTYAYRLIERYGYSNDILRFVGFGE